MDPITETQRHKETFHTENTLSGITLPEIILSETTQQGTILNHEICPPVNDITMVLDNKTREQPPRLYLPLPVRMKVNNHINQWQQLIQVTPITQVITQAIPHINPLWFLSMELSSQQNQYLQSLPLQWMENPVPFITTALLLLCLSLPQ